MIQHKHGKSQPTHCALLNLNLDSLHSPSFGSLDFNFERKWNPKADRAKFEEKERKKLEIRQRLEAQMKSTQKKKGFMTPERKKRLRVSLSLML